MNLAVLLRLFICLFVLGGFLYLTIDRQNQITEMRFAIPQIAKEIEEIKEENTRLFYEIECFENPIQLMQLTRLAEYSHLKHPYSNEILTVKAGDPFTIIEQPAIQEVSLPSKLSLAALLLNYSARKED